MIFAPVVISLLAACVILLLGARLFWVRLVSMTASFVLVPWSAYNLWFVWQHGTQRIQFGGWESPFGISFHVGLLGAALVLVSAVLGLSGMIASLATLSPKVELRSYHAFFHFLMAGVFGAFSTGDLFNLYVWFEVLLMASFFLAVLLVTPKGFSGGFKYAILSILSSFVFLIGIALVYDATGSLDIGDIQSLKPVPQSLTFLMGVSFLAVAFAIKAGLFPFYFWLPASYPQVATAVAAVFSGLLTKVGVYGLLVVVVPFFPSISDDLRTVIYLLALISMVLGVLGALAQDDIKGILSFHIISQVGYIVLALSLGTELGVAAAIFYLIHHMVVKANLFFAASYIEQSAGTTSVSRLGGLWQKDPLLGVLFLISALSLIGIPPLSGFWAKVFTLQSLLSVKDVWGVALCLVVSLFTMMSMLKIWLGAFWRPVLTTERKKVPQRTRWLLVPLVLLNVWTVTVGLNASFIFEQAQEAQLPLTQKGEK